MCMDDCSRTTHTHSPAEMATTSFGKLLLVCSVNFSPTYKEGGCFDKHHHWLIKISFLFSQHSYSVCVMQ